MALQSVISIDVDDGAFKSFKDVFDRYTEALKKQPDVWKKIGQMNDELGEKLTEQLELQKQQQIATGKRVDAQDKEQSHLGRAAALWSSISHSSRDVTGNISAASTSLLKWTTILTGFGGVLGVIGGLFGMGSLARDVAGMRRSANGRGLSIGEQSSFGINFGRILGPDADGFLSRVAEMGQDRSQQGPAYSLLGRGLSGNTEKDALALLQGARGLAQGTQLDLLGPTFRSRQLDDLFGPESQRLLKTTPNAEWSGLLAGNRGDSKDLNVQERIAKNYQDLATALERNEAALKASTVTALDPFTAKIAQLSTATTKLIEAFMRSDEIKKAIDTLANALGGIADFVRGAAHPVDAAFGPKTWEERKGEFKNFFAPDRKWSAAHMHTFEQQLEFKNSLPPGILGTIEKLEGAADSFTNPRGGAMGRFQFKKGTWADWGEGGNPFDPVDAVQAASRFVDHLYSHFHGDLRKTLAAYNQGQGAVDNAVKAGGNNWANYLKPEGQAYVGRGMHIQVSNAAGSDLVVATSTLVGP